MTTWQAEVRAEPGSSPLTGGQIDALNSRLPGFPLLHHDMDSGQLTLRFQFEAGSILVAAEAAHDAATSALREVWPAGMDLTGLCVSAADSADEPGSLDELVAEIAEWEPLRREATEAMLGISGEEARQCYGGPVSHCCTHPGTGICMCDCHDRGCDCPEPCRSR